MICQPELGKDTNTLYPISFMSVRFDSTQQNYATIARELCAVLHTLQKGRLFLSSSITIYTDNKGIVSLGNSNREVNSRLNKFLDLLSRYNLIWRYLPGAKNVVADYLSRFGLNNQPFLDLSYWESHSDTIILPRTSCLNAITTDTPLIEDENFQYTTPNDLNNSDLIEIKRYLSKHEPLPNIYSKIASFFTVIDTEFYFCVKQHPFEYFN